MKEAEPSRIYYGRWAAYVFVTHACIIFKVLYNFFSYQNSLSLEFLLGAMCLNFWELHIVVLLDTS